MMQEWVKCEIYVAERTVNGYNQLWLLWRPVKRLGDGQRGVCMSKDEDGLLPSNEFMEFACCDVHHAYTHCHTYNNIQTF